MSKPLAPHGTYARFVGRPTSNVPGCRCQPCATVGRNYSSRRQHRNATGDTLTVPPGRAAQHLRHLLANGASWNTIAAAGLSDNAIRLLLAGRYRFIRRTTEQKILAIQLRNVLAPTRHVPAIGAQRRLRALVAIGHQVQDIAAAVGVHVTHIRPVLNGHADTLSAELNRKITAAYERLSMTVGPSRHSVTRARQNGWAPPLAWDDDTIDNPSASPAVAPSAPEQPAIDEVAVRRLALGDTSIQLPAAEKPLAAVQLAARGLTPWAISKSLHVHHRSVQAWIAQAA